MKEKILNLIIGMLIGAVITAGIFLIINKNNTRTFDRNMKGMQRDRGDFNPNEMENVIPGENSNRKGGKNKTKETTQNTIDSNATSSQEQTATNTTV